MAPCWLTGVDGGPEAIVRRSEGRLETHPGGVFRGQPQAHPRS